MITAGLTHRTPGRHTGRDLGVSPVSLVRAGPFLCAGTDRARPRQTTTRIGRPRSSRSSPSTSAVPPPTAAPTRPPASASQHVVEPGSGRQVAQRHRRVHPAGERRDPLPRAAGRLLRREVRPPAPARATQLGVHLDDVVGQRQRRPTRGSSGPMWNVCRLIARPVSRRATAHACCVVGAASTSPRRGGEHRRPRPAERARSAHVAGPAVRCRRAARAGCRRRPPRSPASPRARGGRSATHRPRDAPTGDPRRPPSHRAPRRLPRSGRDAAGSANRARPPRLRPRRLRAQGPPPRPSGQSGARADRRRRRRPTTPPTTTRRTASPPAWPCSPTRAASASSSAARATASRSPRTRCRASGPRWRGTSRPRSWPGSTTTPRSWRSGRAHAQPGRGAAALAETFVADAVLARTPATSGASTCSPTYEQHRRAARRCPAELMPEGHTLHRLARLHRRRYAGEPVAVTSPQGRFATSAEIVDGPRAASAPRRTASTCSTTTAPTSSCTCTSACTGSSPTSGCRPRSRAGRSACGWSAPTHYGDLRGPTACELITDAEVDGHPRPPRRGPAAPRRRPGPGLGPDLPLPGAARHAAHGPVGDRGRGQRLPGRGAVPPRARPAAARPQADPRVLGRAVGRPGRPAPRRVPPREDRDPAVRARPAAGRRPSARAPARRLRLPAHRRALPGLRHAGRARAPPGPQPVLVPGVPGPRPVRPVRRAARRTTKRLERR